MKIGVDLDGVVVNIMQPILERYNSLYGTSWEYEDLYSHDLWDVFGITKEESMKRVLEIISELDFDEVVGHEGAVEGLKMLNEEHELIAITSRPTFFEDRTLKWIEKYVPGVFKKIVFTNQYSNDHASTKTSKSAVCRAEGIDIMFEDYIDYILDCAPVCKKVFMFSQPWNRNVKLPENAIRVMNWGEVLKEINGI